MTWRVVEGPAPPDREPAPDSTEVLVEGPWRHRFVAANGARFHVAEAGPASSTAPLVVLLHGFPQFWWAWRHALAALSDAGHRAVAMDLRGYGASDKPPRGYDTATLAADVEGVVRALGADRAVIVGHDWGGWLAWSMPALAPRVTAAVAVLSMGHPLAMRARTAGDRGQRRAGSPVLGFQVPVRPERRLTRGDGVERLLVAWSAPADPATGRRGWPDAGSIRRYRRAMLLPFVAHCSLEYFRWAVRSVPRTDGRRFAAAVRDPLEVPVLHMHGALDPYVLPATAVASHAWAGRRLHYQLVPDAGHFLPEEAPDAVAAALLRWLPTALAVP